MLTDIVVEIMEGGSVPEPTITAVCASYAIGRSVPDRRKLYRVVEVLARKTGTAWSTVTDAADCDIDAHFRDNLMRASALCAWRRSASRF